MPGCRVTSFSPTAAARQPVPLRTIVANRPLGLQWVQRLSCGCEVTRGMPGRVGEQVECPHDSCPMLVRKAVRP